MPSSDPAQPSFTQRSRASVLAVLASVIAGVALGVSIRINATLGAYVGPMKATFIIHVVGTVFATALLGPRLNRAFAHKLAHRPRYELTGGLLGVAMVLVANLVVPVLGTALAVSLFVAADLFFSSLTDHFGWFGFRRLRLTPRLVLGLLLAVAGVILVRWG